MLFRTLRPALIAVSAYGAAATVGLAQAPLHRSPVERQTLVQLAYVLGEAHALHRLCAGPADATWYARMERLEREEGADESFRRQLVESFNSGFAYSQAAFPDCGRPSQAAERQAAERGSALAHRLAESGAE